MARFIDDQTTDTVIIVWANNTATYAMVGKVSLSKLPLKVERLQHRAFIIYHFIHKFSFQRF